MKTFEEMTIEEKMEVYNNTMDDIAYCCEYDSLDFSDMDGICPIFKEQDADLWKKFFGEKKDDNA